MGLRPRVTNTPSVIDFHVPLDNQASGTHQVGSISPANCVYNSRYGYPGPWQRTTQKRYAKVTDGRIDKSTWTGEVPWYQNLRRLYPQLVVTSPGKGTVNKPQLTAQDVLLLQILRARGVPV